MLSREGKSADCGSNLQFAMDNLWPTRLHEVTCQAVARIGIDVQETDAGIEPKSGCSQSRFRFEQRVHVIQHFTVQAR